MQRRRFLSASAALAAAPAVSAAPYVSFGANRPAKDAPIVGHGDFRYRVHRDWQQDHTIEVRDCHEMLQAPDGRLFMLTNHTANNVVVYDTSGKVLDTWGTSYPGAHGLTLTEEGGEAFLLITDQNRHKVFKTTLDGREVMTLDYPEASGLYASEDEYKPTETAVGPDGSIYVADGYGKSYVHRYSPRGRYVSSFGGYGTGPSQLDCSHGVALDARTPTPTLLVTSRAKEEFKRYSLDGDLLQVYPTPGMSICRPVIKGDYTYFAVIVTDSWFDYDSMIAVFDRDMKLVSAPGSLNEELTYTDGELDKVESDRMTFFNPHDVCVDRDDNLYIPQWYSGRTYPVKLERVG